MAELKTKATAASVDKFIKSIESEQVRDDCRTIAGLMEKATKSKPKMWGPSIVGFGSRKYKYPDGREMDWMMIAFSPRKKNITLYVLNGRDEQRQLLDQLGKHSTGKGCLYINKLSDVHLPTLKKIIKVSVDGMKKTQG